MDKKSTESVKASHKHNITSIVISHLNINFSRNKYDTLIEQINEQKCKYSHNFRKNNGSSESIRIECISQWGWNNVISKGEYPIKTFDS